MIKFVAIFTGLLLSDGSLVRGEYVGVTSVREEGVEGGDSGGGKGKKGMTRTLL